MKDNRLTLCDISVYRNEVYGVCIIWIMLFHGIDIVGLDYLEISNLLAPVQMILSHGNIGVEVFLICSGICLFFSFQKNNDIIDFYKKRSLRLFMPIILINGVYGTYLFLFDENCGLVKSVTRVLLIDFWITGDQQIWFVSLIFLCYILYPYIYSVLFSKKYKIENERYRCILLILITILITIYLQLNCPDFYNKVEIALTRIPVFILGCFLGKSVYYKKTWSQWWILILAIITLIELFILNQWDLPKIVQRYAFFCPGLMLTLTIPYGLKILKSDFLNKILSFCGEISLNLYLAHIMVIRFYKMTYLYAEKSIFHYFVILIISVVVAYTAEKIIVLLKKNVHIRKET